MREYGHPPSLRELAGRAGLRSTWTVRYHLAKLRDAGYVKLSAGISRGIQLPGLSSGIPVLGRVSAGKPIDVIEDAQEHVNAAGLFPENEQVFALKVKGESMTGAGINDGDPGLRAEAGVRGQRRDRCRRH